MRLYINIMYIVGISIQLWVLSRRNYIVRSHGRSKQRTFNNGINIVVSVKAHITTLSYLTKKYCRMHDMF